MTVPSLDEPTLAPAGCSTLYVLEPVPNLTGSVDWTHARPARCGSGCTRSSPAQGYPSDVVTEELVTRSTGSGQGMAAGTPFALAHTFPQTGPFRPGNVERRLPGLFFAGSGTVPGVGVPMVLISGKLAAERVRATYLARSMTGWAGALGPATARGLPAMRSADLAVRHDLLLGCRCCCPGTQRQHVLRALRALPARRRHRRLPDPGDRPTPSPSRSALDGVRRPRSAPP